jgi:hypothetical protein
LVWNQQDVPEELRSIIERLAPQVAKKLRDSPEHVRNISEFAKQQACWMAIARTEFEVPAIPEAILLEREEKRVAAREEIAVRRIDIDIEMDRLMVALSGKVDEISAFARKKGLLSPRSDSALRRLARSQFALSPSERNALRHLLTRLAEEGFPMPAPAEVTAGEPSRERQIELTATARRQVRL